MKLAEALAARADATRKVAQLRARIKANATYQEGETPAEDVNALLGEAATTLDELETLMCRINRTNSAVRLTDGHTLTDALAKRDASRLRYALLTEAAEAGSGQKTAGWGRQLRSELRTETDLDVTGLRRQADQVALELRQLDLQIQEANWQVTLIED